MPKIENLADLRKIKDAAASRILIRGSEETRVAEKLETRGMATEARDVTSSLS
ncbi:MAG: hypothetical protein LBJ36_07610 [Synergistaceae bacterium]|jgi:hypothetical protein|nr:hypothetical protein [Synergistaceae bacterium]